MYQLNVNGEIRVCGQNKRMLDFLRDDLHLMGAKDACSEGACGACSVIADGRAVKTCVLPVSDFVGKKVITIEGLDERDRETYVRAFTAAGAVQCGYCTPGFVMAAKALLDSNPNPTDAEIVKAIRGNICRCTGYVKIIGAVRLAARMKRGEAAGDAVCDASVGNGYPRVDVRDKILGTAVYADDLDGKDIDGLLYAACITVPSARARILSIDWSAAEKHPDFIGFVTKRDVPHNVTGHLRQDWTVMYGEGDVTKCRGDVVGIVVSAKKETLAQLKASVKVEYEALEPVTDPERALSDGAPRIHDGGNLLSETKLDCGEGDVGSILEKSAFRVRETFRTPAQEHAFMEVECAVAIPFVEDGRVVGMTLRSASQNVYDDRRECSSILRMDPDKFRVISTVVGGGFGGKEDMSVQHYASVAAFALKRPVKLRFSRQESIFCHPKRHPMVITVDIGCDAGGHFTGLKASILADTGAYASLGEPVLQRACTHIGGPYGIPRLSVVGRAVYTNNPPSGAFRGFGVTQSMYALESAVSLLAEKAGLDDYEIRIRNALRPGDRMPNDQIAGEDTGIVECLEAARDFYYENPSATGLACAIKNAGVGVGSDDAGRARLEVRGGKCVIFCGASCMGQGAGTAFLQIVHEVTGIDPASIMWMTPDTALTPDSGTSTASRQTLVSGEAVRRAAVKLKADMDSVSRLADLDGREYFGEFLARTDPFGSRKPNPVSHVAYSYFVHAVRLNEDGRIGKILAVADSGTIVNRTAIEGQIEGGTVMGMGFALTEDMGMKDGIPANRYMRLGLLRASDIPEIEVKTVRGPGKSPHAFGAKGVGEISSIAVVPAIGIAYFHRDGIMQTSLPLKTVYGKK